MIVIGYSDYPRMGGRNGMELKRVAGGDGQCDDGRSCPTISLGGGGDLVVTGPSVHGLDLPLTDYLRYELASYRSSMAAGMETYIADRDRHPDLAGLTKDFWMFDEQHVAVMRYDPECRPLGPEVGEDPAKYVAWRDRAM